MRIICKDLSFTYEPKKKNRELVLDNISFTINEGEFFGIVGHTGSGKSTLIQHLNALIPLQSGQLFVGDFDLSCKDKDYNSKPCKHKSQSVIKNKKSGKSSKNTENKTDYCGQKRNKPICHTADIT